MSARGGLIQLFGYEESGVHKSVFKGFEGVNPGAPGTRADQERRSEPMKFDYALRAPDQWAGVTVEIHGKPDVDGTFDADDVSAFCEQCELNKEGMVIVDNMVFEK